MSSSCPALAPSALKAMLGDGAELALLDVREQGIFYHAHLLFACCVPLGRLELLIDDLVPRRTTRVVLCDGGADDSNQNGSALRAAERLRDFGYQNVAVVQDGVAGWRAAGFELFSGINVPSKAFGELVEQRCGTPHLSAAELHAKRLAGEKIVILDSRPMDEFERMSIPGGIACPGAELVYRAFDAAPEPDTLVVVNCAGRTRSIIGAQSLINAGLPNPVAALKDGTMGWQLAGFELAYGETTHAARPSASGLAKAKAAAAAVAARFGVREIDIARLNRWRDDAARTLYILDVRTPGEFASGHLPGSRSAPGGQLVQATDEYIATRNARVVLVDDSGVRAQMTGSWLRQMGWDEVYVLAGGFGDETLIQGAHRSAVLGLPAQSSPGISAAELRTRLTGEHGEPPLVIDFATSLEYRRGHIPDAYWAMRTRLRQALRALPAHSALVLTSPDSVLARLAAADLSHTQALAEGVTVEVLAGGTQAWQAAGLDLTPAKDDARLTCTPDDVWYKPYEHRQAVEQAMRDYLTWEVNLVEQIERDGDARFRPGSDTR